MQRLLVFVVIAFVIAACGTTSSDTTIPPTTSPTTAPSTTTSAPTTTSTSLPGDQTPPTITVWSGLHWYSKDGVVIFSGRVDEPATVAVDGVPATVDPVVGGTAEWSTEIDRQSGIHEIVITAEDKAGNQTELSVTLTVDPDLEVVFAYLTDFDGSAVTADYAQWFTGEEANAAARQDGEIGADETVPNDFYIRNENPRLRTLSVAEHAPVVLQTCFIDGPCVRQTAVTHGQWAELLTEGSPGGLPEGWQWYGAGVLPYWLTLQDGVVVQIVEQYLP